MKEQTHYPAQGGGANPLRQERAPKSQAGNCLCVCVHVYVYVVCARMRERESSLSVLSLFLNGLLWLVRWFSHYERLLLFQCTPPKFHSNHYTELKINLLKRSYEPEPLVLIKVRYVLFSCTSICSLAEPVLSKDQMRTAPVT